MISRPSSLDLHRFSSLVCAFQMHRWRDQGAFSLNLIIQLITKLLLIEICIGRNGIELIRRSMWIADVEQRKIYSDLLLL